MTRYYKFAFSFFLVLGLVSCDSEIGPSIDFSEAGNFEPEVVEQLSTVPAREQRRSFLMEFTGGACSNCPRAAEAVETILENNPDNFVPIGMHCRGLGGVFGPATTTAIDFTLDEGAAYFNLFSGIGIPSASVDLFQFPGFDSAILNPTVVVNQLEWENFHEERLLVPNPVNLSVGGSVIDGALEVSAEIVYTEDVTEDLFVSVFVLESHIIDQQLMPDLTLNTAYEHNHIVRRVFTPTNGSIIANGTEKLAGTKVTRNFSIIDIPGDWVIDNLEFVAIVHRSGSSLEVLQAAKSKI